MGSAPPTLTPSPPIWPGSSKSPHKKIKHPIDPLPVVRPESELAQVARHVFLRDVDVCRADGVLEQHPERLDVVGRVANAVRVGAGPFLARMADMAVPVAVASE